MDFFEAVERRRSVRKYTDKPVPADVIEKALDAALLAPNSSNMQTWTFYWIRSAEKKARLSHACLDQSAARTAQELLVVVADLSVWKTHRKLLYDHYRDHPKAPPQTGLYYKTLMPLVYGWTLLAPIKWLLLNAVGLFRPIMRSPVSPRDVREIVVKSAALAAENFMLAIAAQGFDTCPMEGFDECRVSRLLKLKRRAVPVMVISVGERTERGVWGDRFRVPKDLVLRQI